jgi:hypothetical protein
MTSHKRDDMYRVDAPMEIPKAIFVDGHQQDDEPDAVLCDMNSSRKRLKLSAATHGFTNDSRTQSPIFRIRPLLSKGCIAPVVQFSSSLERESSSSGRDATHQAVLHTNTMVADRVWRQNPEQPGSGILDLPTNASGYEAEPNTRVARDVGWDVEG